MLFGKISINCHKNSAKTFHDIQIFPIFVHTIKTDRLSMNKTVSYTIVGLSANLKGEAQAFLTDLEQNRWEVMLCHDASYRPDPYAVVAIVGGRFVGHICSGQNREFWGMMSSVASKQGVGIDDVTIYAEVESVNRRDGVTERVSFNVIPDFEGAEPVTMIFHDCWSNWGNGLMPLPKSQDDVLRLNASRALKRVMTSSKALRKPDVLKCLESYKNLSRHDLSAENRKLVEDAAAWLLAQEDEDLQAWGKEYVRMTPGMNQEGHLDERMSEWWPSILQSAEGEMLWRDFVTGRKGDAEPTKADLLAYKDEMLQHLRTMPGELPKLLNSGKDFFAGLFYMKTPREALAKVYGCIVLCFHINKALSCSCSNVKLADVSAVGYNCCELETSNTNLISVDWLLNWTKKQDGKKAEVVHKLLSDFEIEKTNPELLSQLEDAEGAFRPQLNIHTDKIELNSQAVEQNLNFHQVVGQLVAKADNVNM